MLTKQLIISLLVVLNLTLAGLVFSAQLYPAESFFFDRTQINDNYLQVGDWTPPESTTDPGYPLNSWFNHREVTLHFISSDNVSQVVEVSLYYSYGPLNEYNFHLYQTKQATAGDFTPAKDIYLTFRFTAPLGDGHYDLAVVAKDAAGNEEALPIMGSGGVNLVSFDIDTTPPTTALSLGESNSDRFLSADEEVDGSFENNDLNGWQVGGDQPTTHHLVDDPLEAHQGEAAYQLGVDEGQPAVIDRSYLEKEYTVSTPSFLSFYWRYIAEDYTDFDHFDVWLINHNQKVHLLNYGLDINDPPYDTDWQETSYFLSQKWLNQNFKLRFEMVNGLDNNCPSRVLIDDIRLLPADHHFISSKRELNLMAKDASGSGVATINVCLDDNCQSYQPDLVNDQKNIGPLDPGINNLSYWSEDELGQVEATKSATIIVKKDSGSGIIDSSDAQFNLNVVINQFLADPDGSPSQGNDSDDLPLGEWVELFNRSQTETIDLSGWYLEDESGHIINLTADRTLGGTTLLDPQTSLRFYLNKAILNNGGDTLYLYDLNGNLIDKVHYSVAQTGKSWLRQPDGYGSWMDPTVEAIATSSGVLDNSSTPSADLAPRTDATFSSQLVDEIPSSLATPSATPTPTLSPSPSPTVNPTPSLTPLPTPTPLISPSPTSVPTPSLTPTAAPTLAPTSPPTESSSTATSSAALTNNPGGGGDD